MKKHLLSNINEQYKKANCSVCNTSVTYYFFGFRNGKPRYRCANSVLDTQRILRNTKNPVDDSKLNFVYLIQAPNNLTKIGVSGDINKRFSKLQYQSPVTLNLLYSKKIPYAYSVESYLHRHFSDFRSHGEWFN